MKSNAPLVLHINKFRFEGKRSFWPQKPGVWEENPVRWGIIIQAWVMDQRQLQERSKMPVLESKGQRLVDEGLYLASLREVNTAESDKGEYLQWEFDVIEKGFDDIKLRANSSMAFGPRSKARPWVEALLGRKLTPGEAIDTDSLKGSKAMLSVTHQEKDGVTYAKVDSVLKAK